MQDWPAALLPLSKDANHTEVAYSTIKRRIIQLELPPGSQFTEGELAREAGVSKSPVRDALGRLQRDGLVESIPRSGYKVSLVTLGTTRDLGEFRSIIEPAAARLAAERGVPEDVLDRLDELSSSVLSRPWDLGDDDGQTYLLANLEFDSLIVNACGNRQLTRSVIAVLDDLERVLRLVLPALHWSEQRVDQRQRIVQALRDRDGEEAHEVVLLRTRESAAEVFEALLNSPSVLEAAIAPTASPPAR